MTIRMCNVLLLMASALMAQEARPNFSGTWKYAPGPSPIAQELDRIDHREPEFIIIEIIGRADLIYSKVFRTDGTELRTKMGVDEVVRTAHWQGRSLILDTVRTRGDKVTTDREEFWLSEDGKSLTKTIHLLGPEKNSYSKKYMDKVPDNSSATHNW